MDKQAEYVEKLSAQMARMGYADQPAEEQGKKPHVRSELEYSNTLDALQLKRDEAAKKLQNIGYQR